MQNIEIERVVKSLVCLDRRKSRHIMTIQLPPVGKIKRFFPLHRICVVKVFILLVQCILRCRTVCLNKCKTEVGAVLNLKEVNLASAYKRFIRFFKIKNIDAFCIGIIWLIIHLLDFQGALYMAMDRTNWKIGKTNVNVLFIGLLLPNGVFIPILWQLYNKRGNSSEEERCELIGRFLKVWQNYSSHEITLLGDREFIGAKWFGFLRKVDFSFVIRARWQDYWAEVAVALNKTISQTEKKILRDIKRQGYFQTSVIIRGEVLFYTVFPNEAKRKKKEDHWLVLISDKSNLDWISQSFRKRWGIEVFFYHCKTNGFNLEDLNLQNLIKAQLMMGVVSICYVLSILNGIKCQRTQKTVLKNYKGKMSKAVSLFRQGYDHLKIIVHSVNDLISFINQNLPPIPPWKFLQWKISLKSVQ